MASTSALQLFDLRHDVVVAHRLVTAGIGDELGPVESDAPESHEPGLRAQPEHLEEQGERSRWRRRKRLIER
jgi:hypothetical protein